MIIQIPFNGFYESVHNSMIDSELERELSDFVTGCDINQELVNRAYDAMDWQNLHCDYAKKYAEYFASEFDLKITYESMTSPREYNFTTDRIFCEIKLAEVMRLFENVKIERLTEVARDMFTSRSGFHSFYVNDFKNWGDLSTWDCNQLQALLVASLDAEELQDADYKIGERLSGNGEINPLLYENCLILNRLNDINRYLSKREERKAAQYANNPIHA